MSARRNPGLVVAVHPTSRGFGWVVFEGPVAPVDWGIATAKVNRSATSMRRFEALLTQYQPSVVVLEDFEGDGARRGARIQDLARSMSGLADNRDIEVVVYTRNGHNWTRQFKVILPPLQPLPKGSALIDGEIVDRKSVV